jgi:hypothetical protein
MAKAKRNVKKVEIDLAEAEATAARLCRLMDWPQSKTNVFEVWRQTGTGKALAIGLEKANELAAELERLRMIVEFMDRPGLVLALPKDLRYQLSVLLHGEDEAEAVNATR